MNRLTLSAFSAAFTLLVGHACARQPLDPAGKAHIPIGIPNTLDSLKTFVEPEGCFSPGAGSYGIYYWIYDHQTRKLTAPTMDKITCSRGLVGDRYLIPWSKWSIGPVGVRTEVCQVFRKLGGKDIHLVGSRAIVTNNGDSARKISVYAALRAIGPAGFDVKKKTQRESRRRCVAG